MARQIVVAGDITIDRHFYEGRRIRPGTDSPGLRAICEPGGAVLLQRLIATLEARRGLDWQVHPAAEISPATDPAACPRARIIPNSYIIWRGHHETKLDGRSVWRASDLLGYGHDAPGASAAHVTCMTDIAATPPADILVLDDAGYKFRLKDQRTFWYLDRRQSSAWTVLKMSAPLVRGDLWFELFPATSGTSDDPNFICVVSANDLRREAVAVRPGLSWERTVDEVRVALTDHPLMRRLASPSHLVIVFSADGALWLERNRTSATLVFDPSGVEGGFAAERNGRVTGNMTVMTAAIVGAITKSAIGARPDFTAGIKAGLNALRDLWLYGHGPAGQAPQGFPTARIAEAIDSESTAFATTQIPWGKVDEGWSIAESSQRPPSIEPPLPTIGLARQIAIHGYPALEAIPHLFIDRSIILDRPEIEAFRSLRRSMEEYSRGNETKPLSIGVFGPPGSGKSFGVKMLAKSIFGPEAWLEFNLAQFNNPSELHGAFHTARDIVLSGKTPVVFWDEFDSKEYFWLRHLLAPMQDGRFQDEQLSHAVGKSIFVFAGGTSERFADFGPPESDTQARQQFQLMKGPDFASRLDAYYDVSGPNQRRRRIVRQEHDRTITANELEAADKMFPVRRALLIRHHLGCKPGEKMDFDSDLLDALLLVPYFRHGSRSLEKLVRPLRPQAGRSIRRSTLPSQDRLQMHVDAAAFYNTLTRLETYRTASKLEAVAASIHENWLEAERLDKQATGLPIEPELDRLYDALEEADKDVNRAAARRIPEVLALAGMTVAAIPSDDPDALTETQVTTLLRHRLEVLAEAEHDGWVNHRLANGWTRGATRDRRLRIHDTLIPYAELDPRYQEKDRNSVLGYWHRISRAGFQIVWLTANHRRE